MKNKKLQVKTAEWFSTYVKEQASAAQKAIEGGVPEELVMNNFETVIRSAAYDAVEIGEVDGATE